MHANTCYVSGKLGSNEFESNRGPVGQWLQAEFGQYYRLHLVRIYQREDPGALNRGIQLSFTDGSTEDVSVPYYRFDQESLQAFSHISGTVLLVSENLYDLGYDYLYI